MLLKSRSIDATQGPILKKIILYALPLILSTLVQKLFNAVDIVVLGNMADSMAVAAVGATGSIVSLVIDTFVGLAAGTKIIFARQFGAKDEERIKRTEDTSLILGTGIGLVVAIVAMLFARWFLVKTNCPAECLDAAELYIIVYSVAAPAIMIYNFGSSVLMASGDTQRPLYYIIISGLVNVILNVVLCLLLEQKVVAVAVSTAMSQIVSAALVVMRLCKMDGPGKLVIRKMRFSAQALGKILRFGLPTALNHAIYPLANLQIQTAVNSFGVASTAGNSAGSTLDGMVSAFSGPFGTTAATFMGQNFGADRPERAHKSFFHCMWIGLLVGGVGGISFFLLARPLLLPMILGNDLEAINYGVTRMFFVAGFYWIATMNNILSSSLNAYGYAVLTSVSSMVCIFGFRMAWMWWIYPVFKTFECLMACFTVSWSLLFVANIVSNIVVRAIAKKKGIKQI
ncbi:MAG: MATE family efflux transporter [Clostridia bacterium]|nr:MATE family efflux transporter [Clostridia bacterium]